MLPAIKLNFPAPPQKIQHADKIMLIGSCFTEHIGKRFADAKFRCLENPHGILFNPLSIVHSLRTYLEGKPVAENELFHLNEIWNHWDFHTRFSAFDKAEALHEMNTSIQRASTFLKETDWLIITLGSAFQYFLVENGQDVANCHRAPGQWFEKRMLAIDVITNELQQVIQDMKAINPHLKVIFTISPVRHIREGVVENNRSKARLIEAVYELTNRLDYCHYFPAYEMVIDVLRDYRFYDIDLVHPNFAATSAVWDYFFDTHFEETTQQLIKSFQEITIAANHKVRFPQTNAHTKFKQNFRKKIELLQAQCPYVDFEYENTIFSE